MTQEDIFKAADETDTKWDWSVDMDNWLICFANMIAAAEREACAELVDGMIAAGMVSEVQQRHNWAYMRCVDAIRARGEK